MARRKPLSEQDVALFRSAAGAVRPLEAGEKVALRRVPAGGVAAGREAHARLGAGGPDEVPRAVPEGVETQLFVRPGMQPRMLRRLRQGRIPVEAEIDLHGMTLRDAGRAIARFVDDCHARGRRCVRVIHGRGHGSREGRPLIKWEVDGRLRERPEVLAFCSARPRDGGTGALYVYLRATGRRG